MTQDAPGPLDYLTLEQLRPAPLRPSFAGIAAEGLGNVAGLDVQLVNASSDLATAAGNLDDGFEGELADAIGDGLEAPGAGDSLDVHATIDTGDSLDNVRQSVQDVLPPADAPIDLDYTAPPAPPVQTLVGRAAGIDEATGEPLPE